MITGGCLCGAIRFEAKEKPAYAGYCFCNDCRKASGSGFVPFMGFASSVVRFSGQPRQFVSRAAKGGEAVRNFCPTCGGLVFGGIVGKDAFHTIYAGALDEPAHFHPEIAIFGSCRPDWVPLPSNITVFDRMPG